MINRVEIEITGKNPDYFLKEIIKKKINLYNIRKENKKIYIIIDYEDYKKIIDIKTTHKTKIVNRFGINKIYSYIKIYYYIIVLFILGIIINILLSNMILKVDVIHPNKNLKKIITKDLSNLGLKKYKWKISFNEKEKIKETILSKEKDILEWIEIEEQGTKYIVKIEERKKNKKEELCPPRHIIAKKNAMITRIEATQGEVVKKINDYVSPKDVIISGLIHNKETIVSKRCSEGKVYGEVWYTVKVLIPKTITKEKLVNNNDYGLSINIFNKKKELFNKLLNYKKTKYNIIDSKIIPFNLSFSKYQEKKITKEKISINTVDERAITLAEKTIKKKLSSDEQVLGKKVLKKKEKNSKIEIEVFFKVEENITNFQNIEELNIEEMNKKE